MDTAAAPRATYIADIFEQHLDELAFLWGRWRAALRDPRYSLAAVGALEERVRARLHGAQVPGMRAWPWLAELLHGPDADLAFSAACVLLRCGDPAHTDAVVTAFTQADEPRFSALAAALAHGSLPRPALDRVRALLSDRPARRAAAAAEVLAYHGALDLSPDPLRYFLEDEDAAVRRAGWRLAALSGVQPSPASFARAMRDAVPSVTHAALEAGAWCRVPGVLAALRHLAEAPSPERMDALYLLAVLGGVEDAPRIRALVETGDLGPARFRLAGACGDPTLMELVLAGTESPDPGTASAAGAAFTRLTGVETGSGVRAALPPPGGPPPDAFEAEFLDRVTLPDASAARREWEVLRPALAQVPRICRGTDASHALGDEGVEMESRHDLLLRRRFHDEWNGTARTLALFPQAASRYGSHE